MIMLNIKKRKIFMAWWIVSAIMICMCRMTVSASTDDTENYGRISANGDCLNVYTLHKSGNDDENFVILFLGDGYTKDEQDIFVNDALVRTKAILTAEPYKSLSHKINVYAVPTISAESGASYLDDNYEIVEKDTYFSITQSGKAGIIREVGKTRAKAIKTAMENSFLDSGGTVKTIHIISNSTQYFGAAESTNSLFSCSSKSDDAGGGAVTLHEISHSIGGLSDEYSTSKNPNSEYANASGSGRADVVKWKNFLGFRGMGINLSDYGGTVYIPSYSCIMKDLSCGEFCEVCKAEIVRRMSFLMEKDSFSEYYIANPDITTEHNFGDAYKDYKVNYGNITHINNHSIEFRTIIQNLTNKDKSFRLVLKVTDGNGGQKYIKQEDFTVAALDNAYAPEKAQRSLSVTIDNLSGIESNDTVSGEVIDLDTGKVVATNKSDKAVMYKINLIHKIKDKDGNISDMPNVQTSTIRVPKGAIYQITQFKQLAGYTYIGNSLNADSTEVTDFVSDVELYYRKPEKKELSVSFSEDKKTFTVTPRNISEDCYVIAAMYDSSGMLLKEVSILGWNGEDLSYTPRTDYAVLRVFAWEDFENITPVCEETILVPQ